MGTRLITSYVVWICVCPADFSRGSMVQVSGRAVRVLSPRNPAGSRQIRCVFLAVSPSGIFDCFFFSLRCHPLVNRKDGSRLLRFFPRAFGPGRTFFPGHRSGPGRLSRSNFRRNHPPNAFPRMDFVAPCVFLNETPRSPGRTRYSPHSTVRAVAFRARFAAHTGVSRGKPSRRRDSA